MATEKQIRTVVRHSDTGMLTPAQKYVRDPTWQWGSAWDVVSVQLCSCAQQSVGIRQRELLNRLPASEPHRVRIGQLIKCLLYPSIRA